MPKILPIKGPHNWIKENLVTQNDREGSYDQMKCTKCGVRGKRRTITTIEVDARFSEEKIKNCDGEYPDRIRITSGGVKNAGPKFANLEVGTEHKVVDPPEGQSNGPSGVWVMGKGEPVKVLGDEFESVN